MSQEAVVLNSQTAEDRSVEPSNQPLLQPARIVTQITHENDREKVIDERSELSNRQLFIRRRKRREKIDLRRLKLKGLLDIMVEKKIS